MSSISLPRLSSSGASDTPRALKIAGVQQAHKEDSLVFSSIAPWPGDLVCAERIYVEGAAESGREKCPAIFIGP